MVSVAFSEADRLVQALMAQDGEVRVSYTHTSNIQEAAGQFFKVFNADGSAFHYAYHRLLAEPMRNKLRGLINDPALIEDDAVQAFLDSPLPQEWLMRGTSLVPLINRTENVQPLTDVRDIVWIARYRTAEEIEQGDVMSHHQHERRKLLLSGDVLSRTTALGVLLGGAKIHELGWAGVVGGYHTWHEELSNASPAPEYTSDEIRNILTKLDEMPNSLALRNRFNPQKVNQLDASDRLKLLAYRMDIFIDYLCDCPLPTAGNDTDPHPSPTVRQLLSYMGDGFLWKPISSVTLLSGEGGLALAGSYAEILSELQVNAVEAGVGGLMDMEHIQIEPEVVVTKGRRGNPPPLAHYLYCYQLMGMAEPFEAIIKAYSLPLIE